MANILASFERISIAAEEKEKIDQNSLKVTAGRNIEILHTKCVCKTEAEVLAALILRNPPLKQGCERGGEFTSTVRTVF